jgi:signal transduction histidine kinase
VHVALKDDDNDYCIEVHDRGPGIPEEHRPRVFEPFFTTKRGGNGLGLYQARILAEKIGGTIRFHSKKNQGSTFYVRLCKNPHC